jgi:hypothetical protein
MREALQLIHTHILLVHILNICKKKKIQLDFEHPTSYTKAILNYQIKDWFSYKLTLWQHYQCTSLAPYLQCSMILFLGGTRWSNKCGACWAGTTSLGITWHEWSNKCWWQVAPPAAFFYIMPGVVEQNHHQLPPN